MRYVVPEGGLARILVENPKVLFFLIVPNGGIRGVRSYVKGGAAGACGVCSATTVDLSRLGRPAAFAAALAAADAAALGSFLEGPLAAADDLTSVDTGYSVP